MSRILYLVCSNLETGVRDAEAMGCTRIAARRFAMPAKDDPRGDDLRVVRLFNEMVPMAGKTPLIQGSDYHQVPDSKNEMVLSAWLENHEEFERFVAEGHGEWVA